MSGGGFGHSLSCGTEMLPLLHPTLSTSRFRFVDRCSLLCARACRCEIIKTIMYQPRTLSDSIVWPLRKHNLWVHELHRLVHGHCRPPALGHDPRAQAQHHKAGCHGPRSALFVVRFGPAGPLAKASQCHRVPKAGRPELSFTSRP